MWVQLTLGGGDPPDGFSWFAFFNELFEAGSVE